MLGGSIGITWRKCTSLAKKLIKFPYVLLRHIYWRWLGTPCSVLVPNQECGKVYELIFYFEVLYSCVLLYSVHVEQVLKPEEQLFSFKIPFLSCIMLCSCIIVFTHTNLFLNWTIQWKLQWHNRYVYARFFNRFALINSSVNYNFNCVYSWLLISCTLVASQQSQ